MGRHGCPLAGRRRPKAAAADAAASAAPAALGVPAGATVPPCRRSRTGAGSRSPVDAFVLARLEAAGIDPVAPADKRTLIRRATIDLWGIPPTAEEVEAFEADPSPDAFARLVDRLLASPRYGERWGRHWLDVARYADTKGYVFTQDRRYPYAYTYRDYVIDAFNADLPYDQFVVEQIAADQLAQRRRPPAAGRHGVLDRRPAVPARPERDHRRPDRRRLPRPAGPDGHLRPLPRPQVRPDPDRGLLLALRRLRQLGRAGRAAPAGPAAAEPAQSADLRAEARARPRKRATITWRRGATRFMADLQARLSEYLKAAHDLELRRAQPPSWTSVPAPTSLNARRLRGRDRRSGSATWRRRPRRTTRSSAPGMPSPPCRATEFAAKAAELQRDADRPARTPKPRRSTRWSPGSCSASPPASMGEVVARYAALFGQLEARWKEQAAKSAGLAGACPSPSGSRSARRSSARTGRWRSRPSRDAAVPRSDASATGSTKFERRDRSSSNATHPAAPARAMVLNDAPQPVDPHVFLRGNPGPAGPGGPAAVPPRARRARPPAVSEGKRPARAGPGDRRRQEPADGPGAGQPGLACGISARGWSPRPATSACGATRRRHPELLDYLAGEFIALRLVDQGAAPADHALEHLSAAQRPAARRGCERDPENRLLWRFNRQRLDFESMRDSLLAVSGRARPDDRRAGRSPITEPPFSPPAHGLRLHRPPEPRRPLPDVRLRRARRDQPAAVRDDRAAAGPLPDEQPVPARAGAPAGRLDRAGAPIAASGGPADPADGVRRLYRRVLGRSPEADELALAIEFVRRQTGQPTGRVDGWKIGRQPANGRAAALALGTVEPGACS